jgi:hypothetical protein
MENKYSQPMQFHTIFQSVLPNSENVLLLWNKHESNFEDCKTVQHWDPEVIKILVAELISRKKKF